MKKVINITIGNIVFLIEEDAYKKLDNYLSEIRDYFSGEDGEDILDDIENSILRNLQLKAWMLRMRSKYLTWKR